MMLEEFEQRTRRGNTAGKIQAMGWEGKENET